MVLLWCNLATSSIKQSCCIRRLVCGSAQRIGRHVPWDLEESWRTLSKNGIIIAQFSEPLLFYKTLYNTFWKKLWSDQIVWSTIWWIGRKCSWFFRCNESCYGLLRVLKFVIWRDILEIYEYKGTQVLSFFLSYFVTRKYRNNILLPLPPTQREL